MARAAHLTRTKSAKQALIESEIRRQALLDSALDCIISIDDKRRIIEFNVAAERTFHIRRSAALGRDLAETILPVRLRETHGQAWFDSSASAGLDMIGSRFEILCVRSDGTEFPAEVTVSRTAIETNSIYTIYVRDITARRRAEEALVWLAAIVESSRDAIVGHDLNGVVTSWNKGAERMYGYLADEVLGKSLSLLIPPERSYENMHAAPGRKIGRGLQNFETVRLTKDGRRLDVSVTVSPVCDSEGVVIGASVITRDITARKLAEEALRKATETSIYASPVPIIAADAKRHVTMWNPAAEKLFGWPEKEVIGKPSPIIPAEEAEATSVLHQRLLSGETLTGIEVRRVKRDGTAVAVSMSATPLFDSDRNLKGIIGFFTDITERKRAEEALRSAEAKYRGIFENAAVGIFQSTPDGRYLSVNPALAHIFGFDSAQELVATRNDIGNPEHFSPHSRSEFARQLIQQGFVRSFEYQTCRRDGKEIWVAATAHPVRDLEGNVICVEGTVQDITQARELEQQLRQMQKIEAVGRLAGGVAHDFNNILMAISSYAELLQDTLASEGTPQRYVGEIRKAVDRAASLTQRLLAFSRKQVISPQTVEVNELIKEQIKMLARLIPENINLQFVAGEALGTIKIDPGQMEQVIMNLVINARDAMPSGGNILVQTEAAPPPAIVKPAQTSRAERQIAITVKDNGCGMDAETKLHIFEPFFTTKEQGKGTGLGLAIVFGIVKQNAGQIVVESELNRGTTFRVYLPQTRDAVRPADRQPSEASVMGHEMILLVEDEDLVRESATEYLGSKGYKVINAKDGVAALDIATRQVAAIDLLITDLIMPKMSGRELAEKMSQIHPESKVIFMSGYSASLLSTQQILNPGCILLQKPFQLTALAKCVRESLDSHDNVPADTPHVADEVLSK